MEVKNLCIHLSNPNSNLDKHNPIDFFCHSLASQFGKNVTLVILSGMGNDGTEGAKFIKDANGTVLVQEPSSASFNSMPQCVIESGLADQILMVEELALALSDRGDDHTVNEASLEYFHSSNKIAFDSILDMIRGQHHDDFG